MQTKLLVIISLLAFSVFAQKPNKNKLDDLSDSLLVNMKEEVKGSKIAIVPFNDETGENSFSLSVAEYLVVAIQKKSDLELVDRTAFQKVLMEIELSQSDLVEDSNAVEIGKMVSAQFILTGSVVKIFGKYKVIAKIINVETAQISSSEAVTIATSALDEISKEVLSERAQASSVIFRSLAFPGWGQFYSHHPIRGSFWALAGVSVLGYLTYTIVDWNQKLTDFNEVNNSSPTPGESQEDFRNRKLDAENTVNDAADVVTMASIITGSVWAVNLLDATWAGLQEKKRVKTLYFSALPTPTGGVLSLAWNF